MKGPGQKKKKKGGTECSNQIFYNKENPVTIKDFGIFTDFRKQKSVAVCLL